MVDGRVGQVGRPVRVPVDLVLLLVPGVVLIPSLSLVENHALASLRRRNPVKTLIVVSSLSYCVSLFLNYFILKAITFFSFSYYLHCC